MPNNIHRSKKIENFTVELGTDELDNSAYFVRISHHDIPIMWDFGSDLEHAKKAYSKACLTVVFVIDCYNWDLKHK